MFKRNIRIIDIILFLIIVIIFLGIIVSGSIKKNEVKSISNNEFSNFKIISSSENKDFEEFIKKYGNQNNITIDIDYAGTLEIMDKLNKGEQYDAVWTSNSIWLYMLDDSVKLYNSESTNIEPVIFAVTKSKAEELGFIDNEIYTQDIVNAIKDGKLKFSMSNPTRTNTGATAYLGLLANLAGRPEVLRDEHLNNEQLKEDLVSLFSGLERSSGDEEFLEELFLEGNYEAVVTYESSIIKMNKTLEKEGKEILYALYPKDGVSISDSPFAYIDNGNKEKKEFFKRLQSYILSNEGQQILREYGRRTWYGGICENVDENVFNPEWGINTKNYIASVKYPNSSVIKKALNLYQTELRKATHVVFCLDYSGSMQGEGYSQLINAMDYILNDENARNDLLQFSQKDKISIIPFSTRVLGVWNTENGTETKELLQNIHNLSPIGSTAIYQTANQALEILSNENSDIYNLSVVLMTDGEANKGTYSDLANYYTTLNIDIPIYSIMFGEAEKSELQKIADLTNAKVFDGRINLLEAFKEVRGYN